MTTTSPGTHEFPYKAILIAITAIVLAAGAVALVFAIGEWTQREPIAAPISEVTVETPAPNVSLGGLTEALAEGKLDAGLTPASTSDPAAIQIAPVAAGGQASLYDALIAGKLATDYDTGVQYVRGTAASDGPDSLWVALNTGKLDAGLIPDVTPDVAFTLTAPEAAVVEGTGSLYDALVTGKLDMDYDSRAHLVRGSEASYGSEGLWAALMSGQLDQGWMNDEEAAEPVPAEPVPTLSGGHQE